MRYRGTHVVREPLVEPGGVPAPLRVLPPGAEPPATADAVAARPFRAPSGAPDREYALFDRTMRARCPYATTTANSRIRMPILRWIESAAQPAKEWLARQAVITRDACASAAAVLDDVTRLSSDLGRLSVDNAVGGIADVNDAALVVVATTIVFSVATSRFITKALASPSYAAQFPTPGDAAQILLHAERAEACVWAELAGNPPAIAAMLAYLHTDISVIIKRLAMM